MTDLNALIERLERELRRNREEANLDDRAANSAQNPDAIPTFRAWASAKRQRADDIEAAITLLRTLAERQPVGDVVCYLYQHPNEPDDFGTQNLMPADIAAGWTETPLYTADQAAEQRGEDRGLAEAIRQRIGGK